MTSPWTRALGCGVGLALVGTLCACSPIDDGKVGITRDESGHLVGLALPCKGQFDGAGVYQDDDPDAQTLTALAKWSRREATSKLLRWDLEAASPSTWSSSEPLADKSLTEGHVYVLDAVGEMQKWSTEDLRFTSADLETVTTESVLTSRVDATSGEVTPVLVPLAEFVGLACSERTT